MMKMLRVPQLVCLCLGKGPAALAWRQPLCAARCCPAARDDRQLCRKSAQGHACRAVIHWEYMHVTLTAPVSALHEGRTSCERCSGLQCSHQFFIVVALPFLLAKPCRWLPAGTALLWSLQAALARKYLSEDSGAGSMHMCSNLLRGLSGLCRGTLVLKFLVHQGADRL